MARGRKKKEESEKKKLRAIKVSDRLWEQYVKACEKSGIVPSAHIREMLRKVIENNEKLTKERK